ncbi:MAG: PQQ-dependent sugar dehydrogenase [Gammaproteobacteria bacterium]
MNKNLFAITLCGACLFVNPDQSAGAAQPEVAAVNNPMNVNPHNYLDKIKLPPGFKISMYAEHVTGARSMSLSPDGTLFVGTFGQWGKGPYGKVYAIRDNNGDHKADQIITIADHLNYPNGVAFHNGDLFVAEISRILRFDDIETDLYHPPQAVVINDNYPAELHHGWKFIRFGPDGKLYVPVGAPCNTCEPDALHGVITRIDADGSHREIYARGIRNSVGFDWDPVTKELWFTDNGRDMMGNDIPPEELNHAPRPGLHFGFPYRYGKTLVDPAYKIDRKENEFQPAALEMPAHNAGLGMRFYTGKSFPEKYKNQIFIAYHGSWNRARPDGYRVTLVKLKDHRAVGYEQFATGWLIGDKYWGRPVDIEILPDGSLLVSDDFANCIYRISYEGKPSP